jgi:bifunctional non-homologous end joining protein LigD
MSTSRRVAGINILYTGAGRPVTLTRTDKLFWPRLGLTKGDMIQYYSEMAPYLLPHLYNRPLTAVRYPDGVEGKSFYQKNAPSETPDWVRTYPVWSRQSNRSISYILVNDKATLIWLSNQACLELHPWYSRADAPDCPTHLALDLDPSVPGFERVREAAFHLRDILAGLHLSSFPKTSGATGIQILVPVEWKYRFAQTRRVIEFIARYAAEKYPRLFTVERRKSQRGNRVYIDYLQFAPHKTLIAPYSLRATAMATVSTPVTWRELEDGIDPDMFSIRAVPGRVRQTGDLFDPLTKPGCSLDRILEWLEHHGSSLRRP